MPIIQSTPESKPIIISPPTRIPIPEVLHSRLPRSVHELKSTPDGANLIIHSGHSVKEWLYKQLYGDHQETSIPLDTQTIINAGMYRFDVIGPDVDAAMKQLFQSPEIKKDRGTYMRQATIALCTGNVNISHTSFLSMIDDIYATTAKHRLYHELRHESPCPMNVIRELGTLIPLNP